MLLRRGSRPLRSSPSRGTWRSGAAGGSCRCGRRRLRLRAARPHKHPLRVAIWALSIGMFQKNAKWNTLARDLAEPLDERVEGLQELLGLVRPLRFRQGPFRLLSGDPLGPVFTGDQRPAGVSHEAVGRVDEILLPLGEQ